MQKRIILLTLGLITLAINTFGQQGNLRGRVIDAHTGETLVGVTIFVTGTTTGTTTDLDGNYDLPVDAGTYTISVSYISYQTQVFPETTITAGEVSLLDVNLEEMTTELQEVVITAKARRNTESALQVMQKKSASTIDGISSRQISRLGDGDAAAALKRVTGVSVQDGKYIFVRGLGDRYTKITLNGADIPAMDPEKNTVQMDIFPSNIIENIVVRKTFTPDMPGESTGGNVNITTRDFPEEMTLHFSAKVGFNPQANLNDDFLSYDGSTTDWLGMDNGKRDIPSIAENYLVANGQISRVGYTDAQLNEISSAFDPVMAPERRRSGLDQEYKFTFGNQASFGERAIGYNFALSYSNEYDYYDNGEFGLYEEDINPSPWKKFDPVVHGSQNVNLAALANVSFKLNPNNKIGFSYLRNQSGKKTALLREGYFYYESRFDKDRNLGWTERIFDSYQLSGKHVITKLNKLSADWMVSYVNMNQDEPDLRFFETLHTSFEDTLMYLKTNDKPGRFYRYMEEENLSARVDFELPLTISGDHAKLKFGGAYSDKSRDLSDTKFDLDNIYTRLTTTDVNQFLTEGIISAGNPLGYIYKADREQDNNNSYKASQSVIAAYAMIDFLLANNLRLVGGLRMEKSMMDVKNLVPETDTKYKSGEIDEIDFLPSLQFIYSLNENMNLRFGGSRTLARPAFREIGTNYYDYKTGIFITGNQDLQRSLITNADVRWEWFFKPGEKVALSGFYKYFQDPIEQKLSVETQNFEIKYINTDDANVYGLEFEFRKKLDFVSSLRNVFAGGNFTWVKSVVTIDSAELALIHQLDPDRGDTRPMMGQAPYIVNAFLGYMNTKMGLESNLAFNVTGPKLLIITKGATPYIYEQPFPALNFNISKQLFEKFSIQFSAKNLLDPEYRATHEFDSGEVNFLKFSMGREYSLKISYRL